MGHDVEGPADTAMMAIVHDALRRDLRRAEDALAGDPSPTRRRLLVDHLGWMMAFLDAHHGGEDEGLYPMVRAAAPDASALLDAMDADHRRIHPMMDAVLVAAPRWGRTGSDPDRIALLGTLEALADALLPHLDREEAETMPLVSATLTHRQWHDWDRTYNIKPKSLPVLAEEGHWLLDGLDERRRQIVLHEVPLVPRLIVLHVFGRRYRRHAADRWGVVAQDAAR